MKYKIIFYAIFLFLTLLKLNAKPQIIIELNNGKRDTVLVSENFVMNFAIIPKLDVISYPNPSNNVFQIYYNLCHKTKANLRVFDIYGNLIRSRNNFIMNIGKNDLSWDGIDDNGKRVPLGVYFFQLNYEDKVITKKLVISR